jgi:hypothetical protein
MIASTVNLKAGPKIVSKNVFTLDEYTNDLLCAFSFRRLLSSYNGECYRVRRTSDNAERDIGFSQNDSDDQTPEQFCGTSDGMMRTWYDQKVSYGLISTTNTRQPRVVLAGKIQKNQDDTFQSVYFDTTKILSFNSLASVFSDTSKQFTIISVAENTGDSQVKLFLRGRRSANLNPIFSNAFLDSASGTLTNHALRNDAGTLVNQIGIKKYNFNANVFVWKRFGNRLSMNFGHGSAGDFSYATPANPMTLDLMAIGLDPRDFNFGFDGYLAEFLLFDRGLSETEINYIVKDQIEYYKIDTNY